MRRPVFVSLIVWILFLCPMTVRAATAETEHGAVIDGEEFRLDEIEAYLERAEASGSVQTGGLSFSEIMRELTKGNLTFVFQQWADVCNEVLFSEIRAGRGMLGQILLLSVVGAVFSGAPSVAAMVTAGRACICTGVRFKFLPAKRPAINAVKTNVSPTSSFCEDFIKFGPPALTTKGNTDII